MATPKLPPATPGACPHEHLKFSDGSFLITCIDCDQRWGALHPSGGHDYSLKSTPIWAPRDTRHDKWVLPRTQKKP